MWAVFAAAGVVPAVDACGLRKAVLYATIMQALTMPLQVYQARSALRTIYGYVAFMVVAGSATSYAGAWALINVDVTPLRVGGGLFFGCFAVAQLSSEALAFARRKLARARAGAAGEGGGQGGGAGSVDAAVSAGSAALPGAAPGDAGAVAAGAGRDDALSSAAGVVAQQMSTAQAPPPPRAAPPFAGAGAAASSSSGGGGGDEEALLPAAPAPASAPARAAAVVVEWPEPPVAGLFTSPPPPPPPSSRAAASSLPGASLPPPGLGAGGAPPPPHADDAACGALPLPLLSRVVRPRRMLAALTAAAAFGGFLGGVFGAGGPPLMATFSVLRLDKDVLRGFGVVPSAFMLVRLSMYTGAEGAVFDPAREWPTYAAVVAAALVGSTAGSALRPRVDAAAITRILLGIVYVAAALMLGAFTARDASAGVGAFTLLWAAGVAALLARPELFLRRA